MTLFRDDGPLARALGATLGRALPVPPVLLILAGLLPLLAVAAFGGGDVSRPAAAAVLAWTVLTVGASCGRPRRPKIRWAQPPLVRATEYAALIWIAALEGPDAYPAAFALLAALTFRHYDLSYRLAPPRHHAGAVGERPLGRLGRPARRRLRPARGRRAARRLLRRAAVLGAAFVGECAAAWLIHIRDPLPLGPGDDDEEDEA